MNSLLLVTLGLAIVLGSILWLRLHAFIALLLGALVVAGCTSRAQLEAAMEAKFFDQLVRTASKSKGDATPPVKTESLAQQARAQAQQFGASQTLLARIGTAMGNTFGKLGLVIALACVIGRCLLASGAAERIVRAAMSAVGPRGTPLALSASSFVLSIPVFFDSVFLLGIPLVKAAWLKVRKDYVLLTLALVTGGTMTHSLVPPTPGPLFVAEELGVGLGLMILVGMGVGGCCVVVGLLFATFVNRRLQIPLREPAASMEALEQVAARDTSVLPNLGLAVMPVALPVLLIAGTAIFRAPLQASQLGLLCLTLGEKTTALALATLCAVLVAAKQLNSRQELAGHLQQAIQDAGVIILLCCAGGAFGATLEQTGIGTTIAALTRDRPLDFGLLPLAFTVTAIIRGAQGSSTVAMFTAVAIVHSIAPQTDVLSYHPVYLAIAIGCGSKPFPWMNDSGFWVISRMSGLTEKETLQTHTPMVTLMGFTGILVTLVMAWLLPLA